VKSTLSLGDNVNTVFALYFIFTGTLYLISRQKFKNHEFKQILVTGFTIYLLVGWPNYFRNFAFTEYLPFDNSHGRTVYSYVHWDIDKFGFLLQEVRILSMFLLTAALWQVWINDFKAVRNYCKVWTEKPVVLEMLGERAGALNEEFSRWQIHSLLLVGGFLCWTYFFWNSVSDLGDTRYVFTAIFIHVVWALSWILLSLPLLEMGKMWSRYRSNALNSLVGRESSSAFSESSFRLFLEATPISSFSIFTASAAALGSFLLPIVQLFFRH
jgi:hypothetical protein